MPEGLKTDQNLMERHLRAYAVSTMDLMIKQREVNNSSRDLEDAYVDIFTAEGGDNGKVNNSLTDLFYDSNDRLHHISGTEKFLAARKNHQGDEFDDGSINYGLWSTSRGDDEDGGVTFTEEESSGRVHLDVGGYRPGPGENVNTYIRISSDFNMGAITVFRSRGDTDGSDDSCPGGDSWCRVKYGGETILEKHNYKDADCGYNNDYLNGGPNGTHTVIRDSNGNCELWTNGSLNDTFSNNGGDLEGEVDISGHDNTSNFQNYIEFYYVQTWDWDDGQLVCENIESLSTLKSALPHVVGVFPEGCEIKVDLSVDGGSTYPAKLSDLPPEEVKNLEKHQVDPDYQGSDLQARIKLTVPSNSETFQLNAAGVYSW